MERKPRPGAEQGFPEEVAFELGFRGRAEVREERKNRRKHSIRPHRIWRQGLVGSKSKSTTFCRAVRLGKISTTKKCSVLKMELYTSNPPALFAERVMMVLAKRRLPCGLLGTTDKFQSRGTKRSDLCFQKVSLATDGRP